MSIPCAGTTSCNSNTLWRARKQTQTQKVKETKKSLPEPLTFNKPQKTLPSLQQQQHDHLWIESCTPEMAHMLLRVSLQWQAAKKFNEK
jgi:hypothetical protein